MGGPKHRCSSIWAVGLAPPVQTVLFVPLHRSVASSPCPPHVPPAGLIFCIWGSWWAYNTAAYYLWASPRRPFRGRTWFPLAGRWVRLLEPVLKLLVPAVAISFELFLDHNMQWQ